MKELKQIHSKYLIPLTTAAAVLRDEPKFRILLKHALSKNINNKKIYEALLQSYLFAGFPSALVSIKIFSEYFPAKRYFKPLSQIQIAKRGKITCQKIYGEKYDKLISNVSSYSPELAEWLIQEGYGKVFSRNQLSLQEREMVNVAILTALKFDDQLYSHINGAYRTGVKLSDIEELINLMKIFGRKGNYIFGNKVFKRFSRRRNSS